MHWEAVGEGGVGEARASLIATRNICIALLQPQQKFVEGYSGPNLKKNINFKYSIVCFFFNNYKDSLSAHLKANI